MRGRTLVVAALGVAALATLPPAARADLASLKAACVQKDAADGDTGNGVTLPYLHCDDGVPDAGGTSPNPGGVRAIEVPQRYDGWMALPAKAPAEPGSGADADGDIALDANVSLPDPGRFPPSAAGYPLVVMMHGCCAGDRRSWEAATIDTPGEKWHYSNAWFASRGYAVLTYTARGFVDGQNRGSTGFTQLDSRRYEVNDYQHLAGQLADDPFFNLDPRRVVVTGGSYGAGFSWMAMTDPTWRSPGGRDMRVAAVAPRYGWTDLIYSLLPNGSHLRDVLPPGDGSATSTPLGTTKRSIVAGLYASGRTGVPPGSAHTTFPADIDQAIVCLNSSDPFESNPACAVPLAETLPRLLTESSAYQQQEFFERVRNGERVPVFSSGAFSDPLFPSVEHRRMAERLKREAGGTYPIQEYYGDYQHFVQSKPKEWGDVCGDDHHVCRVADSPEADRTADPPSRIRLGATTRLNRFIDHYARPAGNRHQPEPEFDVTASLQVCPANAGAIPPDEAGLRFTAPDFASLAPGSLRLQMTGEQRTTNDAEPNSHAATADPIANQAANEKRCAVNSDAAGPGVATYDSPPLDSDVTLIGRTRLTVPHTGSGDHIMLVARLYDLFPDGRQVLVDRGERTGVAPEETTTLDLHGNGWRFERGHRLRLELAQDDEPHLRASNRSSSLTLAGVALDLPVREAGPAVDLDAPRLASDGGRSRLFPVSITPESGERTGIDRLEFEVRSSRRSRFRTIRRAAAERLRFRGIPGRTYLLRARAIDSRGVAGTWVYDSTVVPLDAARSRAIRLRGRWTSPRQRSAYDKRITRSTRRGDELRFRFRGRRLWIIGRKSRRGGRAVVVLDGRRRVVSFRSRRTRNRAVIAVYRTSARVRHSLRIVNRSGRVEIDGLAVFDRRP